MSEPSSTSSPIPVAAASPPNAARCSIPLSAGLSVIVSSFDHLAAPNTFNYDFTRILSVLVRNVHSGVNVLGSDPRTSSYLTLAMYRLLRHLIPHTDAVAAIAEQSSAGVPPTAPPNRESARAAIMARIRELFVGTLQEWAIRNCEQHPTVAWIDNELKAMLSVDAATDSEELSPWQLWLINSAEWQHLAGATVEYFVAEIIELLGDEVMKQVIAVERDGEQVEYELEITRVRLVHRALEMDGELLALWRAIGMPTEYPAEIDVDLPTAYKQQFEQQMRAAAAKSAPWMFDKQQVERRVADWQQGRLPSGDAVFFRRYHIRPLWHTGVDVADFNIVQDEHLPLGTDDERRVYRMKAGVDLVDAAGVSHRLVIECAVHLTATVTRHGWVDVRVSHDGRLLLKSGHEPSIRLVGEHKPSYLHTDMYDVSRLDGPATILTQYICHGHLHGLNEQQWDEAMGGRLRVPYYSAEEYRLEKSDDKRAVEWKDDMFPTRLADVGDREQYRRLQRAEIRRMAAIAIRLCMLDEGVDVAIFPCFHPAEMRRQFESVIQARLETSVAGLPAALPRDLQGIVMEYNLPLVDIPL